MFEIVNDITMQDPQNHQVYLNRMTSSARHSTKSLIPVYAHGEKILDVGCGSGVLLNLLKKEHPESKIEGLEINAESAKISRDLGFKIHEMDFFEFSKENKESYDCVIFSSVLHEISSYASDPEERFSIFPIENAIKAASEILKPGGELIIRDGLKYPIYRKLELPYIKEEVGKAFLKYLQENPIPDYYAGEVVDKKIIAPADCIKEFLFTYTWGEQSWHREVKEQYGILTQGIWLNVVQSAGFIISRYITSPEEYLYYLQEDFGNTPQLQEVLSENTILICADKISYL